MPALRRLIPDRFVLILIAATIAASVLPVSGGAVAPARAIATAAIILLFFLNGVRLPRREVLRGLTDWRTQGGVLLLCFGLMPALGLLAAIAAAPVLPSALAAGLLYAGVLPSTVQSATAATTAADGDVAASIVAAALLNLTGILVSPLLFAALVPLLPGGALVTGGALATGGGGGGAIDPLAMAGRVALLLLLPFALGQLAQGRLSGLARRHRALVTTLDRTAIAIAVYVAFSGAVVAGVWRLLDAAALAILGGAVLGFLLAAMAATWWAAGRIARTPGGCIALFFSGHQKSIAVGAPLAALLFPPAIAGIVLLPILLYHLAQLIAAAWLAPAIEARARQDRARVLSS